MKVRLWGTKAETDRVVDALVDALRDYPGALRSVSDWYPNRGTTIEGRVYVEIVFPSGMPETHPVKSKRVRE